MVITLRLDPRGMEVNPKSGKIVFRYSDILSTPEWPEGPLVELVRGDLFMVPSPNVRHQRISKNIFQIVSAFLKKDQLGEVFYAPVDVVLSEIDVVIPDLFIILNENSRIVQKEKVVGTPDAVIEILSTNKEQDIVVKKDLYEQYKVKEYWIVDPTAESVEVFVWSSTTSAFQKGTNYKGKGSVTSTVLKGLSIPLKDIFS